MPLTEKQFKLIKSKYQYLSSWAIWAEEGETPKSNIGDLSILNPKINKNLLNELNPEVIFVALNISRGDITIPFGNFHDARPEATDFKIRYAFKDTPFWGGYMTDVIKDFDEKISGKVKSFLSQNRDFEKQNIEYFLSELNDVGSKNPTLIAFGNDVYDILNRNIRNKFKILKVPHYANYTNKEKYREQVKEIYEKNRYPV